MKKSPAPPENDLNARFEDQTNRRDTSTSSPLQVTFAGKLPRDSTYEAAQARCFSMLPRVMRRPEDRLPTRDEIYDRPRLR